MPSGNGAFDGLNILELAQGVAAPYCGMLLARHGAEVVKIEPMEGDWSRALGRRYGDFSSNALVANRGKRSLALNLKSAEGQEIAQKLARKADVIIENYRPGVIKRLGLDYDSVLECNPNIIYASMTGFGETGPNKDLPATDTIMQGYTGMMSINRDAEGNPRRLDMLAIDTAAGLYLFQAISAALYKKATKGAGEKISTSLLHCALAFQEAKMVEFALTGSNSEPAGAPVETFKTIDGFISINARRDPHFKSLCAVLGTEWATDSRFHSPEARVVHRDLLKRYLIPVFAQKTTDEWAALLTKADILHAPVKNYGDIFDDPQVRAIDAIDWQQMPEAGRFPSVATPGIPNDRAVEYNPAPSVGQQSDTILSELGYSFTEIETLRGTGILK